MWTQDIKTLLSTKIAQELNAALQRKDYQRTGLLSTVANRLEQHVAGDDEADLQGVIEALLGREIVADILAAASHPALRPAAVAQPETRTPDAPQPAVDPGPATPPALPSPVEEPAPQPAAGTEMIPQGLLQELRNLEQQPPQKSVDLPKHIESLQRVLARLPAEAHQGSAEARQASASLAILRSLNDVSVELNDIRRKALQASQLRRLNELSDLNERANRLRAKLKAEQYERYQSLTEHLNQQVGDLVDGEDGIVVQRDVVAAQLRIYLTRAKQEHSLEIETQLDDLDDLSRSGVTYVPNELSDKVGLGKISDIYPNLLRTLLEASTTEAKRLYGDAERALNPETLDIDWARKRCEAALTFVQTKHLKGLAEARGWEEKIQALLVGQVAAWEQRREEARKEYANATKSADARQALAALDRAQERFPRLQGLREERVRWLEILWQSLSANVERAIRDATTQAAVREYLPALSMLSRTREQLSELITSISDGWRTLDPPHEVKGLTGRLDQAHQQLLAQQGAWLQFKRRLDDLRQRGPGDVGSDFAAWWERQEKRCTPEELAWFEREWNALKSDLAERAGDDALYATAQEKYRVNPLDSSLGSELEGIARRGGDRKAEAEQLLKRHRAAVALNRAQRFLRGAEASSAWLTDVQTQASLVRSLVSPDNEPGMVSEADALLDAARRLMRIEHENREYVRVGAYKAAADHLQEQEKTLDQRLQYAALGLATLRVRLRRDWRQARMTFIESLILIGPTGQCEARREPTSPEQIRDALADWKTAKGYVGELEDYRALTEDGDGLRAACVRRLAAIAALSSELGCHPNDLTEEKLADLWRRRSEINWRDLVDHLSSLLNAGAGGKLDLDRLSRLRALAVGYQALNAPTADAVNLLRKERGQVALSRHAVICGLLTLRLHEQPGGQNESKTLLHELKAVGPPAAAVTKALDSLQQAFDFRAEDNLELAIKELGKGITALEQLEPAFAAGFETATQDTMKTWRTQQGQRLRDNALEKLRNLEQGESGRRDAAGSEAADQLAAFEVLRELRQADGLLDNDTKVSDGLTRVRTRVKQATDSLHREVTNLLETPPRRLDDVIRQGRRLEGYLQVLLESGRDVAEPTSGRPKRDPALNEAQRDLDDLQERLNSWVKAQESARATRGKLQSLLDDDWRWNQDPAQTPNKELSDLRKGLANTIDQLRDGAPPELKKLKDFVVEFERQTGQLGKNFESFRSAFEGDTFQKEEDFNAAVGSLREFQSLIESAERSLRAKADAAGWSGAPVDLGRFFLLNDHYETRVIRDGNTIETPAEPIKTVGAAIGRLNERKNNWQQWKNWVGETQTCLSEIQTDIQKARKAMGGQLQSALNAFGEQGLPSKLGKLREQVKNLPPTPRCQAAFRETRAIADDEPDLPHGPELEQAWEKLRTTTRREITNAWREYLEVEMQLAEKEIALGTQECERMTNELGTLIERMDRHIKHFPRPNSQTQGEFSQLLNAAERIDSTNSRVKMYRQKYDNNDRQIHP